MVALDGLWAECVGVYVRLCECVGVCAGDGVRVKAIGKWMYMGVDGCGIRRRCTGDGGGE